MGVIYRLPVSVDDLDAAVFRSIPDYSPYVVEFKREEIPPFLVVYRLWCKEMDARGEIPLGEIKLARVEVQHSTLEIEPPPALWKLGRKDKLHQSIKGHYDAVMKAFFNRLERDGLLPPVQKVGVMPDKPGHPPDPDYDWAYEQILEGKPKEKVYSEWQKRVVAKSKLPDNSRECFNKAMRSRRRKEGIG